MKHWTKEAWKRFKKQKIAVKVSAFLMIFLIIASAAFILHCIVSKEAESAEIVAIFLNTLVSVLGFYAIYASMQNDSDAKQFEFYANYNFNFLTNPEFIQVERMLESCNQEYERIDTECKGIWLPEEENRFQDFCDSVFGTKEYKYEDKPEALHSRIDKNNLINAEYQKLVNYLVYLEAFVPLIINHQLHYDEVDDLFGYRYFIAMNNPVLQEMELFRERPYYRGCFKIYDEWKHYRKKDSLGYVMPMEHYDLLKGWDKYKTEHTEAKM